MAAVSVSLASPACAAFTVPSLATRYNQGALQSSQCSFCSSCAPAFFYTSSSNARVERLPVVRAADPDLSDFEKRLDSLRRVPRGEGAKSQRRSGAEDPRKGEDKKDVYLEPVSLQEPTVNGVPLNLGFKTYAERLNGQFALLGLGALLGVELYTGGSFVNFHEGGTIGTQAYFVLALSAILIKVQKEKISTWPDAKQ